MDLDLGTPKMIARKEGGVGWMIFNQPEKHNAMSYAMWLAVPKIIASFEADPAVRVIVLTGAGEKAFVSGADISEFEEKRSAEEGIKLYDAAGEAAQSAIINASKPTVAMVRGICIGGGLAIALNTDVRIASANSVFAVPAARLGLGYRFTGIKRLVDIVGPSLRQGDLLLRPQVLRGGGAHHGPRQPRGAGGRAGGHASTPSPQPSAATRPSP